MKEIRSFATQLFVALIALRLLAYPYGHRVTWFEVSVPVILIILLYVWQFVCDVYGVDQTLKLWVLRRINNVANRRAAKRMAKKINANAVKASKG